MRHLGRTAITALVALSLIIAGTPAVRADLVSTSEALALEDGALAQATLDLELAREELTADLTALGVDQEVARLRASMLSAAEIEEVAGRIQDLPAGGGVVGVLGVTFIVLLVLELVGVIDIFKKI